MSIRQGTKDQVSLFMNSMRVALLAQPLIPWECALDVLSLYYCTVQSADIY